MSFSGDKIPEGYSRGQLAQYTPQQMQLHGQQYSHVDPNSYLSRLAKGDESLFAEMEAPAHRQFGQLLGQIGSRFSNAGMGSQKGSGFRLAGTTAASNFAQDLASKRQELQRQAISDLMGYSNQILGQRPYERFLSKKEQEPENPFWSALGGAIPGAVAGFMAGGPPDAAIKGAQGFMQNSYRPNGPQGSYSRSEFGLGG